jgi:Flp pilus assembly protein TadD
MAKRNKKQKKPSANVSIPDSVKPSIVSLPATHLGIIAMMVALVYSPSIGAPFYFDDFRQIIENSVIQNPFDLFTIANYSPARSFGYLTFALDHAFYGNSASGFHITNSFIHLLAGWAVFGLLMALIRSPVLEKQKDELVWLPLIAALIFALHPLQTQAVTYIVQRLASLTGLLYISSLAFYAWGRITSRHWFYLLALTSALLALFTKQNALTLPAAIVLLELMFFRQLSSRQVLYLFIFTLVSVLVFVALVNLDAINQLIRASYTITRPEYLATQVIVLWRYIGLFFFPSGQRLDYDVTLQSDWLDPVVLIAATLHICLILFAYRLWIKSPLVSFSILFFYLTHLVESGVIPIPDLMFEHRTYLPNTGLSILVSFGLVSLLRRSSLKLVFLVSTPALIVITSVLTFERNQLWADQIRFLEAETRLSPDKERVWTSLGKEQMRRGQLKEASISFTRALNLGKTEDGLEVRPATLMNAVLLHHYNGQFDKAFELQRLIPPESFSPIELSKLHEVSGITYLNLGKFSLARKEFSESIFYTPNLNSEAGLATVDLMEGNRLAAEDRARQVLAQEPRNILATRVLDQLGLTTNR